MEYTCRSVSYCLLCLCGQSHHMPALSHFAAREAPAHNGCRNSKRAQRASGFTNGLLAPCRCSCHSACVPYSPVCWAFNTSLLTCCITLPAAGTCSTPLACGFRGAWQLTQPYPYVCAVSHCSLKSVLNMSSALLNMSMALSLLTAGCAAGCVPLRIGVRVHSRCTQCDKAPEVQRVS
jgi:hypothetical protein